MSKLTTRITALLLSGMLAIGSVPGSVLAASTDVDQGQTSEITEEVFDEESSEVPASEEKTGEIEETSEDPVGAGETAEKASAEEEAQYYTVTLDANGGYFENEWDDAIGDYVQQAEMIEKYIPIDGAVAALPVFIDPDDQTMIFAGWSLERDGELVAQAEEEYMPVDNCVLYAVWQAEDVSVGETESQEVAEENSEKADVAQEPKGIDAALGDNVVIEDSLVKEESSDTITAEEGNVTEDAASESYTDPETESEQAIMDNHTDEDLENTSKESSDAAEAEGETQLEVFESSEEEVNVREGAAKGIVASGTCGNNLTWTLDSEGTLTISGKGDMDNYEYDESPWRLFDIKTANIESGVSSIGERAFFYSNVQSVIMPETITIIKAGAFYSCKNLVNINIPASVIEIEDTAFSDCSNLHSVIIPDSVERVGISAFRACISLKSVKLSERLTEIEERCFFGCTNLKDIIIPQNVTYIGDFAFYECDGLENFIIPKSVTKLGFHVFEGCSNLSSVTIPDTLTTIRADLFTSCSNVTDIYYIGTEEQWNNRFENKWYNCLENPVIHFCFRMQISINEDDSIQLYTGSEIKPMPIVTGYNNEVLLQGVDYTISYFNNVEPGNARIVADGLGKYYGQNTYIEFTISETLIRLDSIYECSPNKELILSADVISKKVAPNSSNVTWTLTPLDGQEANTSWSSMLVVTSSENQYIISKPVTVSAVGKYKLTVSFNGATATSTVVIDSSLKAKFYILRQNELKEYYTYYNGTEMKPSFTVEMDGENISLDRLTYHYEDNDKPGMAKLVIDTLDGNAVNSKTKFLILPGIVEKPTVKSENAGELTATIKPVDGWKDYQIDICDKDGSLNGYPKSLTIENLNEEGVYTHYVGMLEMDQEYTVKIREIVYIDGNPHGGGWIESLSKKTRTYEVNKDFWRDTFEVNQWRSCSLTFGTDSLKYTGKGNIRIIEKGTKEEIYSCKLSNTEFNDDNEKVIEKDGVELRIAPDGITITVNVNARAIKNTATYFNAKIGESILKPDTEYCIVIDPNTFQYCHYDSKTGKEIVHDNGFIGIKEGDITVKTIPYALPTYRNPSDFPIDISFYNDLFGSSKGEAVRKYDDGQNGWCFGLSAAVSSYYRGNSGIKSIVDKKSLFTDVEMDTTGNNGVSFEEYVKYAQLYCYTPMVAKQRYNNKNKTSEIIRAVKNKEYPIISFMVYGGANHDITERHGHAVTGLYVEEEDDEKTVIRVYNSSAEKDGNRFSETLTINKDGSWTTQSGDYSSGPLNEISYYIFDGTCEQDIMNVDNVAANNYLVFIKANAKPKGDGYTLGRFNSGVMEEPEKEGSYYWSENGVFSLKPESLNGESGEANYLSIFGDDDKTTLTFPFSSEIEVNKPEGKYDIVMNADTEQKATFTYEYCEEKPRKIEINSVSSGDIHFVTSDNGLIVSCDNGGDKELSVTATDEKGDSRTIAVPVTQNDISITAGGKLIVSEDTTKDGLFDKIIAEEPFVTDISSDTVSIVKLDDQTYTGEEIKPDILLKHDNDLKKDTDYTVSYSNNINVGTATVIITGKGNYKGTITKTFNINPAPISPATVTGIAAKSYTGKALTQSPVVKVGSTTLKANSEYTVAYKNNINAGKATVTITGKGNYTGTKTATFKINKAAQSIMAKARASRIAVGKTATVTITGNNGTKSYKSSNTAIATVTSAGKITAKKVGTVKITATSAATANYNAASKTVTIKVVPAATASLTAANQATGIKLTWKKVTGANGYKIYRGSTLIKTITSGNTVTFADTKANTNGTKYTYKVLAKATTGDSTLSKSRVIYRVSRPAVSSVTNSASKKMTVKWGKNAKANGYQIQYSTDKTFKTGNKAVSITSASTVSKVIGSLTKGKTYYVRIRTYKTVGSAKYWSIWSAARSVKISK